eukprot:1154765-Pelagomonas_calceolata.AAC.3
MPDDHQCQQRQGEAHAQSPQQKSFAFCYSTVCRMIISAKSNKVTFQKALEVRPKQSKEGWLMFPTYQLIILLLPHLCGLAY